MWILSVFSSAETLISLQSLPVFLAPPKSPICSLSACTPQIMTDYKLQLVLKMQTQIAGSSHFCMKYWVLKAYCPSEQQTELGWGKRWPHSFFGLCVFFHHVYAPWPNSTLHRFRGLGLSFWMLAIYKAKVSISWKTGFSSHYFAGKEKAQRNLTCMKIVCQESPLSKSSPTN